MPEEYTHSEIENVVEEALRKIECGGFCSVQHYTELVKNGTLKKKSWLDDDREFQEKYPEHPLSKHYLEPRMAGADTIRDAARQLRAPLRPDLLDRIHRMLFDCSGAVRLSLSQALLNMDSETSIPHLEELVRIETGSKMVLRTAKMALLNSQMSLADYRPTKNKLIMLVSRREDLIEKLLEVAKKTDSELYMPRRDFRELIAWSSAVQVVDRWFMCEDNWNAYCDYLREVAAKKDISPITDNAETAAGGKYYDHSALIITDHRLNWSLERFQEPMKPPNTVYYLESGPDDLVADLVYRILTNGNVDFDNVCDTVNGRRGTAQR